MRINYFGNSLVIATAAIALAGCLTGGSTDEAQVPGGGGGGGGGGGSNSPPTISGSPQDSVVIGNPYSFEPRASDPDGDALDFTIQNRPSWASFDSGSGELSGMPNMGDEGMYADIRISVSDGSETVSLPAFSVEVMQVATGSATLTWAAPTQNVDSTPLTDLAGYKIYYGTSPGDYTNEIRIDNPGLTTYVVENLNPDTYYFVATAFNDDDVESSFSNVAVKTVDSP